MTPKEMGALYDYNNWANGRLLEACEGLSAEQFTRELGSSFPSLRDTLAHIMGAEWIWLERWNGRWPTEMPPGHDFADLATLRARWEVVAGELLNFVHEVTASELEQVVQYRNMKGKSFSYPLVSMLQHVVNHGTYHRGQGVTMLRQLGAKPKSLDLLLYLDFLAGRQDV
jgi:uncharacterized damage-inducible protein DinB